MEDTTFANSAIAKEMERLYGSDAKIVKIQMCHEEEVRKYVKEIEDAHKRAANSKLRFL